jgi:hypothetical protein
VVVAVGGGRRLMSGSSAEKSENPLATDLSALFPDVGGRQTTCRHYFRTSGADRRPVGTTFGRRDLAGISPRLGSQAWLLPPRSPSLSWSAAPVVRA